MQVNHEDNVMADDKATGRMEAPEVEQIQRIVTRGYNFDHVHYLILEIVSVSLARKFLAKIGKDNPDSHSDILNADSMSLAYSDLSISELINKGNLTPDKSAIDIAFTYRGLLALEVHPGITEHLLPELSPAFVQGAHWRSAQLGDTGRNASCNWDAEFQFDRAHIVITVRANSEQAITERCRNLENEDEGGLAGWKRGVSGKQLGPRDDRREHFGYVDGISQPVIRRFYPLFSKPNGPVPDFMKFEAGEFLLGYPDEVGENLWALPEESEHIQSFFRNGSFAAFRKMEQNVELFELMVGRAADELGTSTDEVRAKLCGRYTNGKPLSMPPVPDHRKKFNHFDYRDDPNGVTCPLGAHIRRVNPRQDINVIPKRRRPVMRRGTPYGDQQDEDKGLLGLFFCASLENQFEFIMKDWVNSPPTRTEMAGTKDPLIGSYDNELGGFDFPNSDGESRKVDCLRQFTLTRGMLYLFYPGRGCMQLLANLDSESKNYIYLKPQQSNEFGLHKNASWADAWYDDDSSHGTRGK